MLAEEEFAGMDEGVKETLVYHRTKTPLGKRLSEIRSRIVASGKPLLDWDDIERELSDRLLTRLAQSPDR